MRIGLHDYSKPFKDARGVVRMDGRRLAAVDLDSGQEVENVTAMTWGDSSMLAGFNGALLTDEHVEEGKDYLVVVVECDGAHRIGRKRS